MTEQTKAYKTVCTIGKTSKTYHTSGKTLQEAREKAMISAAGDGFADVNCNTEPA